MEDLDKEERSVKMLTELHEELEKLEAAFFEQFIEQLRLTEERSAKMLTGLHEELEKLKAAFKNVTNIRKRLGEIHE